MHSGSGWLTRTFDIQNACLLIHTAHDSRRFDKDPAQCSLKEHPLEIRRGGLIASRSAGDASDLYI